MLVFWLFPTTYHATGFLQGIRQPQPTVMCLVVSSWVAEAPTSTHGRLRWLDCQLAVDTSPPWTKLSKFGYKLHNHLMMVVAIAGYLLLLLLFHYLIGTIRSKSSNFVTFEISVLLFNLFNWYSYTYHWLFTATKI